MDFFTAQKNEVSDAPLVHVRLARRLSLVSTTTQVEASLDVNDQFPDPLREPILRKVQFSTISRIDHLGE